jgi:hypothetical protein
MYFDAVLNSSNLHPIFNGTPVEVADWLVRNPEYHSDIEVCYGVNLQLVSVEEYLRTAGKS